MTPVITITDYFTMLLERFESPSIKKKDSFYKHQAIESDIGLQIVVGEKSEF